MIMSRARLQMPRNRLLRTVSFLLAGLFLVSGVSSGFSSDVLGQEAARKPGEKALPKKTAQFSSTNWGVNCQPQANSKKLACVLSQSIVMAKTRQVFLTVSIHPTPANTNTPPYMATVRLPHGLALTSGIQFQVDKQKPGQLTLFTSSQQGVFARVGVVNKLLSSLKKGKQLKIFFQGRNGRKFTMAMSLKGFTAGFEKLK